MRRTATRTDANGINRPRPHGRIARIGGAFGACSLMALAFAPSAFATYGRGLLGNVDDKTVTNFGFVLIAFFAVLVLVLSVIQWQLDKRKQARKAAEKALLGDGHWRGGW